MFLEIRGVQGPEGIWESVHVKCRRGQAVSFEHLDGIMAVVTQGSKVAHTETSLKTLEL